jgi:hypothetical protein
VPQSSITPLAAAQLTPSESITVELVEADETPAVVIVKWPGKPTILHSRRFPDTAALIVRLFSEAATVLAAIKANRRLESRGPTRAIQDLRRLPLVGPAFTKLPDRRTT